MRRPHGHVSITCNITGKVLSEYDTISCAHCQAIVKAPTKETKANDMPGFCTSCSRNVCSRCCDNGGCRPAMKFIEDIEKHYARERMRSAILGE